MNYFLPSRIKRCLLLFLFAACLLPTCIFSQDTWTQKTNFGGASRIGAVGFSIGSKGYIGTGMIGVYVRDFWEWDQATNTWTQKTSVPNVIHQGRSGAIGFSIGSKGYIGIGEGDSLGIPCLLNDFWEWDLAANTWTRKANFPGGMRARAVGFSIGNKGYVGTGDNGITGQNDFWEYDPVADAWTQKANFPDPGGRARAVGFSIGTKGYIGTGWHPNSGNDYSDFWEWDQATNIWTQKTNLPGGARDYATGFSIGSFGFIGTGTPMPNANDLSSDWWRYDPCNDTWTHVADIGGGGKYGAAGYSIGCKGYVGIGSIGMFGGGYYPNPNNFWEYDPVLSTIPVTASASSTTLCYWESAAITASCGIRYLWSTGATTNSVIVTPTVTTTYSVFVVRDQCDSGTAIVTINVDPMITHSFSPVTNADCFGNNNGSATVNVSGGTSSYSYLWNSVPAQTTQTASGLHAGVYFVAIQDALGCSITDTISITSPTGLTVFSSTVGNVNCFGAGTATVTATGGIPGYTYSWNPTNQTASTATALASGMYTVTITDNGGCIVKTFVPVTEPSALITTISTDTSICYGTNATENIFASGGTPGYTYSWMNAGETTRSITVSPSVTTTYTAQVTDANGCSSPALLTSVTVVENPTASISFTSNHLCGSGSVQFADNISNATSWIWNFGDGNSAFTQNPIHNYSEHGTYMVTLLALVGSMQCKTTGELQVEVIPFSKLFIPNAFSPNSDGENDFLQLYYNPMCVKNISINIFNRWGEQVFQSTDLDFKWDGTYNGKNLDTGVYVYDLNVIYWNDEAKTVEVKGNVSLLR